MSYNTKPFYKSSHTYSIHLGNIYFFYIHTDIQDSLRYGVPFENVSRIVFEFFHFPLAMFVLDLDLVKSAVWFQHSDYSQVLVSQPSENQKSNHLLVYNNLYSVNCVHTLFI